MRIALYGRTAEHEAHQPFEVDDRTGCDLVGRGMAYVVTPSAAPAATKPAPFVPPPRVEIDPIIFLPDQEQET